MRVYSAFVRDAFPADPQWDKGFWTDCLSWGLPKIITIHDACSCLRRDNARIGLKAFEDCENCHGHGIMPVPLRDLK